MCGFDAFLRENKSLITQSCFIANSAFSRAQMITGFYQFRCCAMGKTVIEVLEA